MKISFANLSALLPLFIIYDLFVFPLFDLGIISIHLSYVLIPIIFSKIILSHSLVGGSFAFNPKSITALSLSLIFLSILGHYTAAIYSDLIYNFESYKSIIYIVFMAMSYAVGKSIVSFDFTELKRCFYVVIIINIFFTVGLGVMPDPIFDLYFSADILQTEFAQIHNIQSVDALRSWYRPLGPHGSPTYSAFAVTVIYIFLVVAHLKGFIVTYGLFQKLAILLSPIILSLLYSSRTEFVFTLILSTLLYYFWFLRNSNFVVKVATVFFMVILFFVMYFLLVLLFNFELGDVDFVDVKRFADLVSNPFSGGTGQVRSAFMFDHAWDRFSVSPIYGTGFGAYKSDASNIVWYYHNDFFYILVTTGLLGLMVYGIIISKYVLNISYVLILPFIITGLTNSFLLVLPMIVVYFFMLGIFSNASR